MPRNATATSPCAACRTHSRIRAATIRVHARNVPGLREVPARRGCVRSAHSSGPQKCRLLPRGARRSAAPRGAVRRTTDREQQLTRDGASVYHEPVDQVLGDLPARLVRWNLCLRFAAPDRHRSCAVFRQHGGPVNDLAHALRRKTVTGAHRQQREIRGLRLEVWSYGTVALTRDGVTAGAETVVPRAPRTAGTYMKQCVRVNPARYQDAYFSSRAGRL